MTNLSSKKNNSQRNLSGKSEKIINSLESLLSDYNFGLRLLDLKQKQKTQERLVPFITRYHPAEQTYKDHNGKLEYTVSRCVARIFPGEGR